MLRPPFGWVRQGVREREVSGSGIRRRTTASSYHVELQAAAVASRAQSCCRVPGGVRLDQVADRRPARSGRRRAARRRVRDRLRQHSLRTCRRTNVAERDNDTGEAELTGLGQLLVGFRVPEGTSAPAGFPSDATDVIFSASPTYAAELEALFPTGPGERWTGYISTAKRFDPDELADRVTGFRPEFGLPGGFEGPFGWRLVAGFRPLGDAGQAGKPVDCQDGGHVCADSPPNDPPRFPANLQTPVSDFGFSPAVGSTTPAGEHGRARLPAPLHRRREPRRAGCGAQRDHRRTGDQRDAAGRDAAHRARDHRGGGARPGAAGDAAWDLRRDAQSRRRIASGGALEHGDAHRHAAAAARAAGRPRPGRRPRPVRPLRRHAAGCLRRRQRRLCRALSPDLGDDERRLGRRRPRTDHRLDAHQGPAAWRPRRTEMRRMPRATDAHGEALDGRPQAAARQDAASRHRFHRQAHAAGSSARRSNSRSAATAARAATSSASPGARSRPSAGASRSATRAPLRGARPRPRAGRDRRQSAVRARSRRFSARWTSRLTPIRPSTTIRSIVASTLTSAGTPWRVAPKMNSGNVCVWPALNDVIT